MTDWQPHPDQRLEKIFSEGTQDQLVSLLHSQTAMSDPFARLRIVDRLFSMDPTSPQKRRMWMQELLLANRPAIVWDYISSLPGHGSALDATDRFIAAQTAQATGKRSMARTLYLELLGEFPRHVDIWQKYVEFESPEDLLPHALESVEKLHHEASGTYQREKTSFSLARLLQSAQPNIAFGYAREAHRLKKSRLPAWSRSRFKHSLQLDESWNPATSSPSRKTRPLFIVGLPRSGTTLVNSILSSHPAIASAGEQNLVPALAAGLGPRHPADPPAQLSNYIQAWHQSALGDLTLGKQIITDKLPGNIERCGLILAMFPDAHIIQMERNLADCATSIHMHDFEYGCAYASDLDDLAHYAHETSKHADLILKRAPDRVHRISYEEMVSDPESALSAVLAAIQLDWDTAMNTFWKNDNHAATYSERQVRSPLNRDSIGSWHRYLPEAEPLHEAIAASS